MVTVGIDYLDDEKNIARYGSVKVPTIQMDGLKDLKVPVSLFVGKHDLISTPVDDRKIRDQLGDAIHEYHEIEADHVSIMIGIDMSYFSNDVLRILEV